MNDYDVNKNAYKKINMHSCLFWKEASNGYYH